jgi:sugar phosphate isomerase/epimerase
MKFGASVWPFKWDSPYDDGLKRIASMGFKAVELIAWDREALDTYYTPQTIKHLRALLDDLGLELSEFVSTPRAMAGADLKARDQALDHFKRMVDVALNLGTNMVNSVAPYPFDLTFPRMMLKHVYQEWTVDFDPTLDWKQNWEDYVGLVRRCCDVCEDTGVKYALESHPYRWMRNAASMMRLLDQVNSPALGMNFDPSHLFPMGEMPQMVIYEVGDRIFHTHFSDNDGTSNAHWRPGKGKIDWRGVLQALQTVGYNGVISIELEDVPGTGRRDQSSTSALDRETRLAKDYLSAICVELNIVIDT